MKYSITVLLAVILAGCSAEIVSDENPSGIVIPKNGGGGKPAAQLEIPSESIVKKQSILEGVWITDCDQMGYAYFESRLEFKDDKVIGHSQVFQDSVCRDAISSEDSFSGSFKITGKNADISDTYNLTWNLEGEDTSYDIFKFDEDGDILFGENPSDTEENRPNKFRNQLTFEKVIEQK